MHALLVTLLLLQAQASGLRSVVLEGEDAVNIVQQKTAVRPLVEVRDRNNVPVSGATVTFAIGKGQPAAFAGGAQTMTVTTNAAGQAAASGYNVVGAGSVQISVQAAYQGLVAAAVISQTTVATAAAAAAAAGGVAAGGGGVSATTIGIIGAGVAGGVVAATTVTGGGDDSSDAGGDAGPEVVDTYRGSFSGPFVFTNVGTGGPISPSTCTFTRNMTGSMRIELRAGGQSGIANVEASMTDVSVTGTQGCTLQTNPITFNIPAMPVSGGPSALTFTGTQGEPSQRTTVRFTGTQSGTTITGSLTIEMTSQTTSTGPSGAVSTFNGSGTTTIPVSLTR